MTIYFCQNYIKQKFEYILLSDTDEYKKYYFHRYYCDLVFFLAEIDRINTDCEKLNKKILEIKTKIFRFCRQCKLFFRRLRELDDRETRNIEDIQKTKKKIESCGNIISGLFIFNNLFFTVSETDRVLATISEK